MGTQTREILFGATITAWNFSYPSVISSSIRIFIFSSQMPQKNISALVIPSSSVLEGSSVTLICSSDGNPAVNYTWFRESEGELEQLQTGDTLTFNRTDPTHRGRYHCTAQNQHGSHNSSVMLDIQCEYNKTANFTSSHSLAPKSQS